jgi:hypothetical protein
MYIIEGSNILLRQAPQACAEIRIRSLTCSCAREFRKPVESLFITRPTRMRTGSTTWKDSKMTNFKLLGVAAILSTVIATPVIAQEAVQEPGLQAFYQSLGVGSASSATASAMASGRSGSYASAPAKRLSAKHYATARKM